MVKRRTVFVQELSGVRQTVCTDVGLCGGSGQSGGWSQMGSVRRSASAAPGRPRAAVDAAMPPDRERRSQVARRRKQYRKLRSQMA